MQNLTDAQLYYMAKKFGSNALIWRRKFIGLLPEINRRRLWEKKGYESVFVFAKKLAGLSEEQVRMVLNLEKKLPPVLQEMLVTGEVSVNKLARVASVATPENEEMLAEKVRVLPKSAVETFVRDAFHKPKTEAKSLPGQTLELSDEVTEKLLKLQEKGIDVNEFLLVALDQREKEIRQEKEECVTGCNSRYIPVRIKKIVQKEHGTKCSMPGCCKPAAAIHHTRPFALSHQHDPRYLAPLCHEHHAIAHSVNVRVNEIRWTKCIG